MSCQPPMSLTPIAFSLLLTLTQPSSAACGDPTLSSVNATRSTSFPGFHPNGSVPGFQDSNWTLHTGIVDIIVPSDNSSFITQSWWLSTDPIVTEPAAEFPFAGCTFLLEFSFYQKIGAPTAGPNTCKNIFNDACQGTIIDMINSNITASGNATSEDLCASIIENILLPAECKDSMWGGVDSQQPFGNPGFISDNCSINNTNIFDGSVEAGSLTEVGSASVPIGNYTWYDEFTKLVTPMIMTMWPKNSTTSWEPDTRLFCITASDIEAGSRVPSSAMSIQPVWSYLYVLGAVVTVVLALW